MKKSLILASLVVVAVSALQVEKLGAKFQSFKTKYGKTYQNQAEEAKRLNIFRENLLDIEAHNALYDQGLTTYKKGVNQFADKTIAEFKAFLTLSSANKPEINGTKYVYKNVALPDNVDWRTDGQVAEVKNQGSCGSCWAFSVTGSTEAAYKRKSGQLVSLSEQQLVDCTRDINNGCSGGYLDKTIPYIQNNGLQTESSYPYTGVDGTCQYNSDTVVTRVDGYTSLKSGDENSLLNAVGTVGPVSIAMDATTLGSYSSGIYDGECSSYMLNHGVLAVGYGTENNVPYWIVKNSWGESFGEQGFFRIKRGSNKCGVAVDMCYPYIN